MAALSRDERTALLQLQALPGIGPARLRHLLAQYGGFERALNAPADELGAEAAALRGHPRIRDRVARAAAWLDASNTEILLESDSNYPTMLRHLDQPPVALYVRGNLELATRPCIALVGTRTPTQYGEEVARELSEGLAAAGCTIVSGLALGIDGVAHVAALDVGGGTIAVQGCGPDVVYPLQHERLQRRIAEHGLLLSEFPPGDPPLRHHFPRRNRLIAALSVGVVVVEAGARSGSLITVNHALELGREVFAVPGPITRRTSAGTNALIRDGAGIVTSVEDLLADLARAGVSVPESVGRTQTRDDGSVQWDAPELSLTALRLWQVVDTEPRHAEELGSACGMDPHVALSALLELELAGLVRQCPGGQFAQVRRGRY